MALFALVAGPGFAQEINIQPQPAPVAENPRVEEGGWAGFAIAVTGSAPASGLVTVTCSLAFGNSLGNQDADITDFRADAAALEPLEAGDTLQSVVTLGPDDWPTGQHRYCEFWTYDDTESDVTRSFRMRVAVENTAGVTVGGRTSERSVQLFDNDATPTGPRTLRFFAVGDSVAEGRSAVFDIVLSRPQADNARLVVPYTITPTTPGNGITAADFTGGLTGTFTLTDTAAQAGGVRQRSKFQIAIADSEDGELAESFTVTLGPPADSPGVGNNPPGFIFLQRSATKTILADDAADPADTTISVSVSPDPVTEGNSVEITFTLSQSYPNEVHFGYNFSTAGAANPAENEDFVGGIAGNRLIAVPAGLTSVTVPLHVLQDGEFGAEQPSEEVTVSVRELPGTSSTHRWPGPANPPLAAHSTAGSATITINNLANPSTPAADFGTVTVSESALLVAQGGSGQYTVVLGAAPGAASGAGARCVTITPDILSPTSGTPVTFMPASVTFSSVASGGACPGSPLWSTAQTITVNGGSNLGEEAIVVKVGHDVSTVGVNNIYAGVAVANGPVVSVPGVPVVPGDLTLSASALSVNQGATAQYTVALDSDPGAATVTVTPSGTNLTFAPSSIQFSTNGMADGVHQWDSAQTFTVTAANGLGAAATPVSVSHAISATPDEGIYASGRVTTATARLTVTIAGHGLALSAATLNVRQGAAVTYTVALDTNPGNAIVTVTPSGTSLTFDPPNLLFSTTGAQGTNSGVWNVPQTFTVTANTGLGTANTMSAVSHAIAAAPNDGPYEGSPYPAIGGLDVTIYGHAGLTLSAATLSVEQGADVTYDVELDVDPGAGNTVTVTPTAAGLTFNPSSIQFSTDGAADGVHQWDDAQTVTVTAAIDATPGAVAVSHALSATGGAYNDPNIAPDFQGPTVTVTGLIDYRGTTRLTVRQGQTAQYAVNLAKDLTDASHTVTITPSAMPAGRLTFSPETLTLTNANFFSLPAATITVTAAAGLGTADITDTVISHTVSAVAGPYMAVTSAPDLPVLIPGRPGLTLGAAALAGLSVAQGATVDYTLQLDTDPGSGNSVTVTPTATGLTFDPTSVTFTDAAGANPWNQDDTITITADASATPGTVAVSHAFSAATGTDYDGAAAYPLPEVTITAASTATIVFTEGADTTMSLTMLTITEGSPSDTPTYTVALSEDPVGTATVTITGGTGSPLRFGNYTTAEGNGAPDGNANQTSLDLTFTGGGGGNWETPQRVLVIYTGDDDALATTVDIMHTTTANPDSGPYSAGANVSVNLPVTVNDDDPASFQIIGLADEIDETPTVSFNFRVRATVQPPSGTNLVGEITSDSLAQTGEVDFEFTPSTVTFTNANWQTPQMITASSGSATNSGWDSNGVEETITITVTPTSDTSSYAQNAEPATDTFLYDEVTDGRTWTVRARGGGIHSIDTNENAQPIPNPNTADPGENPQTGENRDGTPGTGDVNQLAGAWMYFRFTGIASDTLPDYPHTPVTVTYCLGGDARGGTPAQVAANPRVYDYAFPQASTHDGSSQTAYDPAATSPTGTGARECVGRGSFTTDTGTWHNIYRLPIQLNDDSVDEDDETITAVIVHVASADGHARFDNDVATRTIKDNDSGDAFVRIGPKAADVDEGDEFTFTVHLEEAAPAELRVPWSTSGLSSGAAVVPASGAVVFAPGATPMQSVALRVPPVAGLDSTASSQELEISLGTLAGAGAGHYQKQTESTENAGTGGDLTVDGIVFSGTSTVTISFIDEAVQIDASLEVGEGTNTGTYSVVLAVDPGAGETVTVTPVVPAGLSVSPSELVFDGTGGTNLWSTARDFTITADDDDDAADAMLEITHTVTTTQASGDYVNFTDPLRVQVTVEDDDTRGVTVATIPASDPLALTVAEGATGFYTVVLDTEPVGGVVTVTPMSADEDTATVSVALRFTDSAGASPWNMPQRVAVYGVAEWSTAITVSNDASGADYGEVTVDSVAVTVAAAATGAVFSIAPADSEMFGEFAVDDEGDPHYFNVVGSGAAPDDDVVITCTVSGGEVTTGDFAVVGDTVQDTSGDFQTRTLTFTPSNYNNMLGQPCAFTSFDDGVNEGDEDFTVTISVASASAATNATIGAAVATGTIRASDPITFTVARGTPSGGDLDEGGSQSFTVTPSGGTIAAGASVTVPWFISIDSDATTANAAAGDFRATAAAADTAALRVYPRGSLTFTAATAQAVTVHTRDDAANEPIEAFALHVGSVSGAAGAATVSGAPVAVQIAASDQPRIIISPTALTVEVGATVQYTVRLTHRPTGELGVFARSSSTAIVTLSIPGRSTNPLQLGWGPSDENWAEPYTVTVTGVAAGSATIAHSTDSGSQYPHNATLESVTVTVQAPGPRFSVAVASTVTDADSVTDGTQVAEDVGNIAFTVSLSAAPSADATVDWAVTGVDTAADLSSYSATRTLTFTTTDWATAQTVTLAVADDSLNEATETLTVTLSNVGGTDNTVAIATASAEVQITDDDPIIFTVARGTPSSGAVNEGGSQTFTITPSGGTFNGATVSVPWAVGASAATEDTDAAAGDFRLDGDATTALGAFPASSTPLSFTAATAQTVTVYTFNDTDAEGAEAFDFSIGPITGAVGGTTSPGSPATIAINSSDQALTITCTAVDGLAALVEGTATTVANCAHGNSDPLVVDVGVGWGVFEGSGVTHATIGAATAATADFGTAAVSGSITIPSGHTSSQTVPLQLTATDDGAMEAAEQFSLVITSTQDTDGRYARLTPATANYNQDFSVAASEAAATTEFSIAVASSVTDADSDGSNGVQVPESTTSVAFTVSLANGGELTADATVVWAVTGVTTSGGAADISGYPAAAGDRTLTFTHGDGGNHATAQTVTVNLNDDAINEAAETLTVTLSSPAGTPTPTLAAAATSAEVQITDNDALTFTLARTTPSGTGAVTEGTAMTFTATMTGGSVGANAISLPWSIGGTVASGDTEATFGDFDDDNDGTANTETEGLPSGTLTFPANTAAGAAAAAQTFTVRIFDDSTGEGAEAFAVSIGAATGTGIGGTSNAGTPIDVTIAINDVPSFSITPANSQAFSEFAVDDEGQPHYFNVIGSGTAPAADVQITCTVSGSEVTTGDFAAVGDTVQDTSGNFQTRALTFTPGNYNNMLGQTCSFTSFDDSAAEAAEDFTVTITVTSGLAVIGTATAQGTIRQSDFAVGFERNAYTINEDEGVGNDGVVFGGRSSQVCVAVTNPPQGTAFPDGVTFSLAAGTTDTGSAGSGDYTAITNQQVGPFSNSRRQECFVVEVAHDLLNEGDETFRMDLLPPPGTTLQGVTINPSQATVTIPANDPLSITVSGQAQVEEGASAEFTLAIAPTTLTSQDGTQTAMVTHTLSADATVTWSLAGTGITAADFTGVTSLTTGNSHIIALASPDYTFDVAVADDSTADEPETFTLSVTGGSSAGTVQAAASGASHNTQIVAAGSTGALFTVTGPTTIAEGAADVESGSYTVTLTGLGSGNTLGAETQVTWAVSHGDTADADFAAASDRTGMVTFPSTADDGDVQTFTLTVAADTLNEGDEDFSVQVSATDARAGAAHTTTITDHSADATTVTIARDSGTGASVAESATASFTVTLGGGVRTGVITVPVSFGGLSADSPNEYDITAPTGIAAAANGVTLTFDLSGTPGATDAQTVTVNLMDDTLNEATETLTLTGTAAGATGLRIATGSVSYATNGDSASVDVTDDDDITLSIAVSGTDADGNTAGHQVAELTDATFTVSMTDGASTPVALTSAAAITVPYTIGGDVDADDLTGISSLTTSRSLVIAAGQSSGTITIRIADDADTTSEDLTVTLTAASSGPPAVTGPTAGTGGGDVAVTGTATDAAATAKIIATTVTRVLTITAGPTTLEETDTDAATTNYTVTLTGSGGAFSGNTDITWTVTHGTTEAADFSAVTGTVQFTSSDAANSTKTFTLTVVGDNVNEANETFTIVLSGGGTGVGYGAPYSVRINDDDTITYSITADSASVAEADNAEAEFTVTLSGTSEGAITIPVSVTSASTAVAGSDYTAPAATVTVAAGSTTADLDIALINDAVAEAGETIIVEVGDDLATGFSKGAAAGDVARSPEASDQSATVTIGANDALSIAIARKTGETGAITEDGTTSANFTVTVTGTSAESVSVPFTVGGTNITADDYDITAPTGIAVGATGGTLSIAAGAGQSGEITIQASDDSEAELAETLSVTLTAAASGPPAVVGPTSTGAGDISITTASATVGITDDDGITATIAAATDASVTEGGSFSIPVTLSAAHNRDVEFSVAYSATAVTTDNDAEAADRGTATGLTISSGTSGSIMIPAAADTLNEGDETFVITITAATTGRAGGPSIPVTVAGAGATQTLTVQDDAADAITVTITKQSPSGATVAEAGDGTAAADVTFRIALSGGTRTAVVTVPFELGGLVDGEFDITSALDSATDTTAAAAVPAATATGGVIHFTLADTTAVTRDISVNLIDDTLNEAAEELTLTGTAAGASGLRFNGDPGGALAYAGGGGDRASVSVTDNDAITYSIADASAVTEVDAGGTNPTMSFTVSLSGLSAGPVTIPYTVTTTGTSGSDFTAPSGSVTIAANSMSEDIDITILADNLNEGAETITITLAAETAGGFSKGSAAGAVTLSTTSGDNTGVGTINDDDGVTVTLSGGGDVNEGANATVTVTLSNEATGSVTVNYTIASTASGSDNDAEAADYTNTSGGSITIVTGTSRTGTIRIGVNNDELNEGDETFEVRVANTGTSLAGGVTVTGSPRTFTIKDAAADAIAVTIRKQSPSGNSVDEEGSVTFRVTLSSTGNAVRTADLVVPFAITGLDEGEYNITAPAGVMTTATAAILTFPVAGSPRHDDHMDITIDLLADNLNEATETLTITGAANNAALNPLTTAGAVDYTSDGNTDDIMVTDDVDDAITVTITQQAPAGNAAAGENATATFRVALSGGIRTSNVIVPFLFDAFGNTGTLSDAEYAITSALDHDTNPDTAGVVPGAHINGGVVSFGTAGTPSATDHVDVTVNLQGDDLNERTETLIFTGAGAGTTNRLRVGSGGGAISFAGNGRVTLNVSDDDDILYTIDAGPTVAEGDSGDATVNMTYTIRIDHASAGNIRIPYAITGTATRGATGDFNFGDGAVTITAGQQSATLTFPIIHDNLNEADETVIVTLRPETTTGATGFSKAAAAGAVARHGTAASYTATGTITDDDDVTATVTNGGTTIAEGDDATITVALSNEATGTVRVSYTIGSTAVTTDNDAEAADYTDTDNGSIDIVTGTSRTGTITIGVNDDLLNEGTETFTVNIAMSQVGTSGDNTVSGGSMTFSITDDPMDAIAVTITRTSAATVDEDGSATFRVALSSTGNAVRTADVVVPFAFSGTLGNAEYAITTPAGIMATATGGSVTFPVAGSPAATDTMNIVVNLQGDSTNEATETLIITGAANDHASNALRTAGAIDYASASDSNTAQVSVTDDDAITVALTDAADFNEGQNRGWTVRLSGASDSTVTVNFRIEISGTGGTLRARFPDSAGYNLMPSTVTGGTPSTGSATITGLSTNINFHANTVGDSVTGTRTVTMTLVSAHVGADAAADTAAGRTINLGSGADTNAERTSDTADITYRNNDRNFNVGLAPTPQTQTPGSEVNCDADTSAGAPGVQFDEDASEARCRVITFRVTLNQTNFLGDNTRLRVNWAVSVAGLDASATNELAVGQATSGMLDFYRDSDNNSVHNCGTTGDAAGATCPPQDVEVTLRDDQFNEAALEVVFTLSNVQVQGNGNGGGTGIGVSEFRAQVLPSDPITYSVTAATNGAEGDTGAAAGTTLNLAVTLSGATASDYQQIRIPFTVAGTATGVSVYPDRAIDSVMPDAGDDYYIVPAVNAAGGGLTHNLVFSSTHLAADPPANSRSVNIVITTVPDDLNEPNETVIVTLGTEPTLRRGPARVLVEDLTDPRLAVVRRTAMPADYTGTATINDDDDLTLSIVQTNPAPTDPATNLREGSDVTFTVTLSGMSQEDVVVPWSAVVAQTNTDAAAVAGVDDERPNSMTNPDIAATPALTFTDGAAHGDDDSFSGNSVTIAAGSTTAQFTIRIRQDARREMDETVTVTIADPSPTVRGVTAHATDNDAEFTIDENPAATRFLNIAADETSRAEGQPVVFTVTLTGVDADAGAAAQTVDWCITGTVEAGDFSATGAGTADCSEVSGTVLAMGRLNFGTDFPETTAPAHTGARTREVRATITDDDINEAAETLTVTLANIQGGSCDITADPNCSPPTVANTASATVTIAESDPVTYSIASPSRAPEDSNAAFTVRLSGASEGDITVAYTIDSTADDAATGGADSVMTRDYTTPSPLTVTVPAGMTSAQLEIAVNDDTLNEVDETITVELSDEMAATFTKGAAAGAVTRATEAAAQTQTATIRDNDAIRVTVARTSPAGNDEVEEGTAVTFTVTLTGAASGSAGDVTVPWTARMTSQSASTDPAGEPASNSMTTPDLITSETTTTDTGVTLGGTLTIAAGDTTGTVVITPAVDGIAEADESFSFALGISTGATASGGVTTGSPSSVTVGINENIAALHVVNVSVSPTVAEDTATEDATATGGGQITYTFSLETEPVTSDNARTAALTATFTIGGTATSGTDYTAPTWAITFPCTAVSGSDSRCQAAGNADITRTIDIMPDRIDDDAETIVLTMTGVTNGDNETMFPGTAAAAGSYPVTIEDNDVAGIVIVPRAADACTGVSDCLNVRSSATSTYTVRLSSQPDMGDVVITPTITPVTNPVVLSLMDSAGAAAMTHTFTTANWHDTQTITVNAGSVIADDDFRIDYAVTSDTATAAPAYAGVTGGLAVAVSAAVGLISSDTEAAGGRDPATVTMAEPLVHVAGQTSRYPISLGAGRTGDVTLALRLECVDMVDNTCGVTATTQGTTGDGHSVAEMPSVTQHGGPHLSPASPTTDVVFTPSDNTMIVVVEIPPEARGDYQMQVTGITAADATADAYYANLPTANLRVTIRAVAPFNTAVDDLNRVILPEVARALADSQMTAIGDRLHRFRAGEASASFNLGGQTAMDSMLATGIQSEADDGDGMRWKEVLGNSSFHMPLAGGGGGALGGGAFWGGGEYRSIGGESGTTKWDGDITGGHLGFDARIGGSALAGLLVHYGDADLEHEYNDNTPGGNGALVKGDWLLEMTTVNPYFGWQRGAVEGWAMAGFGEGDLEIDETGPNRDLPLEADVSMTTFGLGMSGSVVRDGGREVRIKAEAFATTAEVDEGDAVGRYQARIEELEVDANRVRVMVESSRTRQLASGADFGTSAEFGLRSDGGDGRTGGGSELGLGFHYTGTGGVTLQARARGLIGHRADYDDWGVSGSLKLQPGADGQGLSLALSPAYGKTADGTQGMWDNGLFNAAAGADSKDVDLEARMQVEAGFGLKAFTDTGLLKPHAGLTFADGGKRTVKLGVNWQTTLGPDTALDLDLSTNRATTNSADEFTLKGEVKF